MPSLAGARRTPHMLALFVAATVLPAAALGWLGWRLIEQERALERQRVQDLAESTANRVTAAIERELGAIERSLGAGPRAGTAPEQPEADSSVTVRLDPRGQVTTLAGGPLSYDLRPPFTLPEPWGEVWVEAERLEFIGHDAARAAEAYRRLAASPDPATRAGALIRLARVLRGAGRVDDAIGTYAELATTTGATVLGDPVDLMAGWARAELLASVGRAEDARREAASLDAELRRGRWQLGRTTALAYAEALRPWRADGAEVTRATRVDLSDAVAAVRQEWKAGSAAEPFGSGRRAVRVGERDVLVAWREDGDDLLVYAASSARLFAAWQRYWATASIAVALVDQQGRTVAGDVPPVLGAPVVSRPASETRLPWALRVAATSTPGDIATAGAARRRVILAALVLLAFLIPATGFLVARAVHRELALARQQASFVAAVSHEFRSPLTSLAHLTSLLRSDFQPSDERRRQYYDMLARETDRLRRFVETLLDVGRIQAGAARYHLEPVEPVSVVTGVVEDFRAHAASGNHTVSLAIPASVPSVSADAEALGRALWNLLENAAKYSPEASAILVRLEEVAGHVAICVSDQGAGIPAAERPRIFDQFFRGAAAQQSAVRGTGVGLAVVRHIVTAHAGEVRLDSAVGAGSTFRILLPALSLESAGGATRKVS